ncbi:MAG: AI-2E family transporter [bacterium]|nr:AI-2E family transporter [bacterium]
MKKSSRSKVSSVPVQESLILEKLPGYFLIFCLIVVFLLFFKILSPFLTVIFAAAVLAIAFYPVYKRVRKLLKGWERTASFLTCIFVILVTLVPITVFVIMLSQEGVDTYEVISERVESGAFDKYLQWDESNILYGLMSDFESIVAIEELDLKKSVVGVAQSFSTFLVSQTATLLKSISNLVFNFLIMLFSMFYFFKDGEKIVDQIGVISPLPKVHEDELFNKMGSMVKAIMVGVFLTAIVQGLLGGIGFAIAGISNPVFWGTAIAFFSMVPVFGTAVIWIPASIILVILGSYYSALFLFIWGVVVIGGADNVVRPYLIGGKAHTYPLLTFFVILGGIWTMGFKGIIIGPLVLMALMSFLHIYEAEYVKVLKK